MPATRDDITRFLLQDFPQCKCVVESCGERAALIRRSITTEDLRPGGTVSGPVMMEVADSAFYVALLAEIGIVPMAVTTSLSINFMRKPAADRDLLGRCRLLKLGKSLAVGDVEVFSEGHEEPVAHATLTYALPRG